MEAVSERIGIISEWLEKSGVIIITDVEKLTELKSLTATATATIRQDRTTKGGQTKIREYLRTDDQTTTKPKRTATKQAKGKGRKCVATTRAGNPCKQYALRSSEEPLCRYHQGGPTKTQRSKSEDRRPG